MYVVVVPDLHLGIPDAKKYCLQAFCLGTFSAAVVSVIPETQRHQGFSKMKLARFWAFSESPKVACC